MLEKLAKLVTLQDTTPYDLSNCQTPPFGPPRKGPVGVPPPQVHLPNVMVARGHRAVSCKSRK